MKIFRYLIASALVAAALSVAAPLLAHGVGSRLAELKPIAVEFYYSTGEAMSYTPVQVFSPDDDKHAFQEGSTDDSGIFAFTPNKDGAWQVICEADGGHRAVAKVDVNLAQLRENSGGTPEVTGSSFPQGKQLVINALLGVSLLFNLSALAVWFKRNKRGA